MKILNKANFIPFASLLFILLIPLQASALMCSGTIVKSQARILSGTSEYYKKGMKILWITGKMRSPSDEIYLCSWGGDCINSNDLHLDYVMATRGNTSNMTGAETKENSYETKKRCTLNMLETH